MTKTPLYSANLSIGSPTYEYESMLRHWRRCRAVLNGELHAKEHDSELDLINFSNLLVPFSPGMNPVMYKWYLAEAQLPGLVSQYMKVLVGGLLRKEPTIKLPDNIDPSALDWLRDYFTSDNKSIVSFLNEAITEELTTSRCWVSVDFPDLEEGEEGGLPFPVLWKAEDVINWQVSSKGGRTRLRRVVLRYVTHEYSSSPYHADLVPTVADHYLDEQGNYQVQLYQQSTTNDLSLANGEFTFGSLTGFSMIDNSSWEPVGPPRQPKIAGEPMKILPIFPLNGDYRLTPPMLSALVDKEVALYNKVSRRNHLLFGASTFTPVIFSNMQTEEFEKLARQGLGTWMRLSPEDRIDVFRSPSESLSDYEIAIAKDTEELSQLGIRILSPEAGESGVSLEIRNSTQLAQLGLLNTRLSQTMKAIIALMLSWALKTEVPTSEVDFELSADFDPTPLGGDWMRMVTEWYQSRLVPRSLWLKVAKMHDIIPPDYDDEEGVEEIGQDPLVTDPYATQQQTLQE